MKINFEPVKKQIFITLITLLSSISSGCQLVEGTLKSGMQTGIILIVIVIAIVIWSAAKLFGSSKD